MRMDALGFFFAIALTIIPGCGSQTPLVVCSRPADKDSVAAARNIIVDYWDTVIGKGKFPFFDETSRSTYFRCGDVVQADFVPKSDQGVVDGEAVSYFVDVKQQKVLEAR